MENIITKNAAKRELRYLNDNSMIYWLQTYHWLAILFCLDIRLLTTFSIRFTLWILNYSLDTFSTNPSFSSFESTDKTTLAFSLSILATSSTETTS